MYRRRAPQGTFKENDDFSAILKAIVDLESGNVANPREAQLQSSGQDPFDECEGSQPRRIRTSQSVLYSDFAKEELQRLLTRGKARADAAFENGYHDDIVRHRSWLSSINNDSGAWLSPHPSHFKSHTPTSRFGNSHRYAFRQPFHNRSSL